VLSDPIFIASRLADNFFPNVPAITDPHLLNFQAQAQLFVEDSVGFTEVPSITSSELGKALNSCNTSNSSGHDGIQYWLYKNFLDIVSPFILNIFNACLALQYFPTSWKSALVLVLRKPKKNDYTRPENYRPISMLCTMGKILEKIINNRIRWLSENCPFVSDIENGLNAQLSTVCILLDIKVLCAETRSLRP
jgi:hypothetical protein